MYFSCGTQCSLFFLWTYCSPMLVEATSIAIYKMCARSDQNRLQIVNYYQSSVSSSSSAPLTAAEIEASFLNSIDGCSILLDFFDVDFPRTTSAGTKANRGYTQGVPFAGWTHVLASLSMLLTTPSQVEKIASNPLLRERFRQMLEQVATFWDSPLCKLMMFESYIGNYTSNDVVTLFHILEYIIHHALVPYSTTLYYTRTYSNKPWVVTITITITITLTHYSLHSHGEFHQRDQHHPLLQREAAAGVAVAVHLWDHVATARSRDDGYWSALTDLVHRPSQVITDTDIHSIDTSTQHILLSLYTDHLRLSLTSLRYTGIHSIEPHTQHILLLSSTLLTCPTTSLSPLSVCLPPAVVKWTTSR